MEEEGYSVDSSDHKGWYASMEEDYPRNLIEFDARRRGGKLDRGLARNEAEDAKQVKKEGLSEYFLFTIEGREDIQDKEPKRLVALEVEDVPLECFYKLTDREDGSRFTKYYRFKNLKLTDEEGNEKDLPDMENLGTSPLPDGMVRLFSEYQNKDLAYVGS